jgi:hypothetical protein
MVATGMTKIHYLALDVEGIELQVLKSLPWNRVYIGVKISVRMPFGRYISNENNMYAYFLFQVMYLDLIHTVEGRPAVHEFLTGHNYTRRTDGLHLIYTNNKPFPKD